MKTKKVIIFYLIFVFFSNFCLIEQFFSSFLSWSGYNLTWISGLLLVYQITKFALEIPTGFVSDKYGRKTSGCIGMILIIASYCLLLIQGRFAFILSFFIRGLAITFISGSIESIAVESIEQTKLEKLNILRRLVFYIASAAAAITAGILIDISSYTVVILIDISVSLIALIAIIFIDERKQNESHTTCNSISIKESMLLLKENNVVFTFLLIDFFNAFAFIGVEDLYPAYLGELGIGSNIVGLFISAQLVISAMFGLLLPWVTKIIKKEIILYIFPIISVAVTVLVYAVELPVVCIPIILTIHYILFAVYAPIKYSIFQQNVKNEYRSTFISYSSQAIALGGILFYVFSSILGYFLSMRLILLIAILITLLFVSSCCYRLWKIDALDKKIK